MGCVNWDVIIKKENPEFFTNVKDICEKYYALNQEYEKGRNRIVFIFEKFVIKIPITFNGILDNDWESSISNTEETYNDYRFPQYPDGTKLWYVNELPIIRMERIKHAYRGDIFNRLGIYPDWINSVDCFQVGFNSKGRLVIYDSGLT